VYIKHLCKYLFSENTKRRKMNIILYKIVKKKIAQSVRHNNFAVKHQIYAVFSKMFRKKLPT